MYKRYFDLYAQLCNTHNMRVTYYDNIAYTLVACHGFDGLEKTLVEIRKRCDRSVIIYYWLPT